MGSVALPPIGSARSTEPLPLVLMTPWLRCKLHDAVPARKRPFEGASEELLHLVRDYAIRRVSVGFPASVSLLIQPIPVFALTIPEPSTRAP